MEVENNLYKFLTSMKMVDKKEIDPIAYKGTIGDIIIYKQGIMVNNHQFAHWVFIVPKKKMEAFHNILQNIDKDLFDGIKVKPYIEGIPKVEKYMVSFPINQDSRVYPFLSTFLVEYPK